MNKILLLFLILSSNLLASFEYSSSYPNLLFPHSVATLHSSVISGYSNIAQVSLVESSSLSSSSEQVIGIDNIINRTSSLTIYRSPFSFAMNYHTFGIKEYQEDSLTVGIGSKWLRYLSLGFSYNIYKISSHIEDISIDEYINDISFSCIFSPFEFLEFAFIDKNIYSQISQRNQSFISPLWSGGVSLKFTKGIWSDLNYCSTAFGHITTIDVSINLLSSLSIKGGYAFETKSYSASLSILVNKATVSYGFKLHPYLGASHSIGLTLTFNPQNYKAISYTPMTTKARKIESMRIDISTATTKQLMEIPQLTEEHIYNIIAYRKIIAPISKNSLYQIGLSKVEIKTLLLNSYGYKLKKKFSPKKRKHIKFKRKRKFINTTNLFKDLIISQCPPTIALKICQLAVKHNSGKIKKLIKKSSKINSTKKIALLKICKKYF